MLPVTFFLSFQFTRHNIICFIVKLDWSSSSSVIFSLLRNMLTMCVIVLFLSCKSCANPWDQGLLTHSYLLFLAYWSSLWTRETQDPHSRILSWGCRIKVISFFKKKRVVQRIHVSIPIVRISLYFSIWTWNVDWNIKSWNKRKLWITIWVLEIGPTSSGRAVSALSHVAISLAPK